MAITNIPTSKDIYIEADGKKIAVVESYKAKSTKKTRLIEEFGSTHPVCAACGIINHTIELKRVYFVQQNGEYVDFHSMSNFTIVIVKPNKRIMFTGCEWASISEGVNINEPCVETITVIATRRTEI